MSNIRGLGTFTVIRGKGKDDFQVIVNQVVSEEIKRIRAKELAEMEMERQQMQSEMDAMRREFAREMEWMNMIKKNRNQSREEKIAAMNIKPEKTPRERARERIGFILACFIVWGEALKDSMIEYVGDEEEWK